MQPAPLPLSVLALTTLLLGCYPRPHELVKVPSISGELRDAGKPVAGAGVYVVNARAENGDNCRGMRAVGFTDPNGHFEIGPVTEHHLFASVLNSPQYVLQETSVCFRVASKTYLGMTIVASTVHPEPLQATCDISTIHAPYESYVSVPGNLPGVCMNPMTARR